MNNYRKVSFIAALATLLALVPALASAQDVPEAAAPPFVAPVPDFFQWTISIQKPAEDRAKPTPSPSPSAAHKPGQPLSDDQEAALREVVKVVFVKTKNITLNTIYSGDGKSYEVWHYDNKVIVKNAGGNISIDNAGSDSAKATLPDVSGGGFVGVDWISGSNFQGKTALPDGREAYLYRGSALPQSAVASPNQNGASSPAPKSGGVPVEAVIDIASHLPLLVRQPTRILVYSYQPPPSQMLSLPGDAQQRLAAIQARKSFVQQLRALSQH